MGKKVGARIESRNRTAALLLMMMACAFAVPLPLGMTGSKQQRMDITSACSALFAAVAFMVAHFFFLVFLVSRVTISAVAVAVACADSAVARILAS